MDDKYHGQQFRDGEPAQDVPPMPEGQTATDSALDATERGVGTYAHVRMIGSYGAFCAGKQTLDFYGVALNEARKLRWDYFGLCGATMTCFDHQGNVVHTE